MFPNVSIHPTACIDEPCRIGTDTKIWHFCHVMTGAHIGSQCSLGQNVFVGKDVRIGNRVKVQNNVSIYTGVELEDEVFCGPSVVFTNVKQPRAAISRNNEFDRKKTLVGQGATLGANATIVCGINIGRFAFVGAGAVVTKDVPAHGLVLGNPARLVGYLCVCGEKLEPQVKMSKPIDAEPCLTCPVCNKVYRKTKAGIISG